MAGRQSMAHTAKVVLLGMICVSQVLTGQAGLLDFEAVTLYSERNGHRNPTAITVTVSSVDSLDFEWLNIIMEDDIIQDPYIFSLRGDPDFLVVDTLDVVDGRYQGSSTLRRTDGSPVMMGNGVTSDSRTELRLQVTNAAGNLLYTVGCDNYVLSMMNPQEIEENVYRIPLQMYTMHVFAVPEPTLHFSPGGSASIQIARLAVGEYLGSDLSPEVRCYHTKLENYGQRSYQLVFGIFGGNSTVQETLNCQGEVSMNLVDDVLQISTTLTVTEMQSDTHAGLLMCHLMAPGGQVTVMVQLLPEGQQYLAEQLTINVMTDTFSPELVLNAHLDTHISCLAWGSPAQTSDILVNGAGVRDNVEVTVRGFLGVVVSTLLLQDPPPGEMTLTCRASDADGSVQSKNYSFLFVAEPDVFNIEIRSWTEDKISVACEVEAPLMVNLTIENRWQVLTDSNTLSISTIYTQLGEMIRTSHQVEVQVAMEEVRYSTFTCYARAGVGLGVRYLDLYEHPAPGGSRSTRGLGLLVW